MEQFNLEEYLKNPSKKVVTRGGKNVRIVCTDYIGTRPIIAKIEGDTYSNSFREDGRYVINEESSIDLFFAPEKHEGWVNVYRGSLCKLYIKYFSIFKSKEEAEESAKNDRAYVKTVKIEWEE